MVTITLKGREIPLLYMSYEMKQVQEEQMRLHPEIYEPKKKEDDE